MCFFKQNTAYDVGSSGWSSDVGSSDLGIEQGGLAGAEKAGEHGDRKGGRRPAAGGGLGGNGCFTRHAWTPWVGTAKILPTCQIGRASCRERVCQYVSISVVGSSLKQKTILLTMQSLLQQTQQLC